MRHLTTSVLRASALLAAVALIALLFLPLVPSYDVDVFLRAGAAVLHGAAVYPRVGTPAVYSGSAFVYPYFAVLPFVPLAALGAQLATALFFLLEVSAVIAVSMLVTRNDLTRVLIVLCTAFTITGLQLGSLSPLLFVGVLLMWRLRDRPIAFGLLAAVVVASKLFLAPLLLWPLIAGRAKSFAWALGSTIVLLGAGFVLGPLGLSDYVKILNQLGIHEASAGLGLVSALRSGGLPQVSAEALALAVAASIFAAAYLHFRRSGQERVVFCAGIVASLIVTPVLWGHYLVLLVAALLVIEASRRLLVGLVLVSWLIAPPHGMHLRHLTEPFIGHVTGHGPWLAATTSLIVFAAAALFSLKRSRRGTGTLRHHGHP